MTSSNPKETVGDIARDLMGALQELERRWGMAYLPDAASTEAKAPALGSTFEAPPASADADADDPKRWSAAKKLSYLRERNIGDCQRCPLARTRRSIVFGTGNPEASIMFVGEAPGADEDRRGEPFVGRAGQLLDRWLAELGLARDAVYIANVLKCRPPNNRDPMREEVDRCSPFLHAQIRAIAPRVIVALGRHAGMLLAGRDDLTLRAMRAAQLDVCVLGPRKEPARRIPLVVTYHPAYVLRQGDQASEVTRVVMHDLHRAARLAAAEES